MVAACAVVVYLLEPLIMKSIVNDKQEIYKLKNIKKDKKGGVLIIYYIYFHMSHIKE
jgi:hypothetical protein